MSPIVFYGINGVGLGHIARLSAIARYVADKNPGCDMEALCRSSMGPSFFSCPCTTVLKRRDLIRALGIRGIPGFFNLLQSRFDPSMRRTVVFDTAFTKGIVKKLKFGGHRTILVMESRTSDEMIEKLRFAERYFDHVFFPCQPEELEHHYGQHRELWDLLQVGKFEAVGPFVRTTEQRDETEKVIFTLGGGGEHRNEDPEYSVREFLNRYVEAAKILYEGGKSNLYIAKGPLMSEEVELGHLQPLETMSLPSHFGPKTCVVTRGTYNLGWETIAAGATLVTTKSSAVSVELVDSRNEYLDKRGYAFCADIGSKSLVEAILRDPPENLSSARDLVNARPGLARICDAICAE